MDVASFEELGDICVQGLHERKENKATKYSLFRERLMSRWKNQFSITNDKHLEA